MPVERPQRRRGVALMMALIALLVFSIMAIGVARLAVIRKQAMILGERNAQVRWLAAAGVERAIAKLEADPNCTGDIWIPDEHAKIPSKVTILIKPIADQPTRRNIVVKAVVGAEGSSVRSARTERFAISPSRKDQP